MIIKYTIKDYKKYKKEILKHIDSMPFIRSETNAGTEVSKSDWCLTSLFKRPYVEPFMKMIDPFVNYIQKEYEIKLQINVMWYSQYYKGDFHNWHTHPHAHFSNVFYLEMPKGTPGTEFKHIEQKFDVKEGDILSFPAFMLHRGPKITSNKRKTVIVFDTTFHS